MSLVDSQVSLHSSYVLGSVGGGMVVIVPDEKVEAVMVVQVWLCATLWSRSTLIRGRRQKAREQKANLRHAEQCDSE